MKLTGWPTSGITERIGVLVTLTATDAAGNEGTCFINVMVLDTSPPAITCIDLEIFLDAGGFAQRR
jgi:hypothetical protein